MTERELTALHEAGHAVVAHLLGCVVTGLTVEPGSALSGCTRYRRPRPIGIAVPDVGLPLAAWPVEWRRWAETSVIVSLAGDLAERMFAPRIGRTGAPVADRAAELVDSLPAELVDSLPAATPAERQFFVVAVSDETEPTDADVVAAAVRLVHGDVTRRSVAWLDWLGEEAYTLLAWQEARVRRLAAVALELGTVGAEAAARVLR